MASVRILMADINRNIYYKDPSLFRTQAVVDRCVDALAYTFDIPRASLNVVCPRLLLNLLLCNAEHCLFPRLLPQKVL